MIEAKPIEKNHPTEYVPTKLQTWAANVMGRNIDKVLEHPSLQKHRFLKGFLTYCVYWPLIAPFHLAIGFAWYAFFGTIQVILRLTYMVFILLLTLFVLWWMLQGYISYVCPVVLQYLGEWIPGPISWLFFEWSPKWIHPDFPNPIKFFSH